MAVSDIGTGALAGSSLGPWGALLGAGLGVLKTSEEQNKTNRDRTLQAATARYSPWTGIKPTAVQEGSPISNIGQGAFAGFAQGQNMDAAAQQQALQQKQLAAQQQLNNAYTNNLNAQSAAYNRQ